MTIEPSTDSLTDRLRRRLPAPTAEPTPDAGLALARMQLSALTLNPQAIIPSKPEGTTLDARLTPAQATGGQATPLGFAGFCALGPAHQDKVLTEALARSYRPGRGGGSDLIAGMIRPTPRDIWTPTAAGFLGRVSVDYLDALWTELTGLAPDDPAQTGFMALKKAAKAKELESLFADMSVREAMGLSRAQNELIDGWLPPELQWGEK